MARKSFGPAPTRAATYLYVVVVADHRTVGGLIESGLPDGQFASFIGDDRDAVVERARESASSWGTSRVDGRPYRLLIGTLDGAVKHLREWEVVDLYA